MQVFKIVHWGKSLSFKSAPPRAATAVVVTPLFGCRRLQRPCSTLSCGRPPQSSSSRQLCSILPTASHILCAAKDDDAIATPAAAAESYMLQEWPDFSKKISVPNVRKKFFNRSREYTMLIDYLDDGPSKPFLLLGPINSGKSASPIVVGSRIAEVSFCL